MVDFMAAVKAKQAPAVKPILDPVLAVKSALAEYEPDIQAMVEEAQALAIVDESTNAQAVRVGNLARKLVKGIEEIRKKHVGPLNDRVKAINTAAKVYTERLGEVESGLKKKISTYQYQQEIERRQAEEAARKAVAEEQARLDAMAKANNVAPVVIEPVLAPEPPRVIRTDEGSSHQRMTWTFEVVLPRSVPVEYLMVDERAIREAVKAGVREIPGVKIYQKSETVFR